MSILEKITSGMYIDLNAEVVSIQKHNRKSLLALERHGRPTSDFINHEIRFSKRGYLRLPGHEKALTEAIDIADVPSGKVEIEKYQMEQQVLYVTGVMHCFVAEEYRRNYARKDQRTLENTYFNNTLSRESRSYELLKHLLLSQRTSNISFRFLYCTPVHSRSELG